MPRTKSGEFNQIAYQNEYNKMNYDRIEIKVPKGKKAVIKEAAKAAGQSVNEFINQAIDERMGKQNKQEPGRPMCRKKGRYYENMVLRNIFI